MLCAEYLTGLDEDLGVPFFVGESDTKDIPSFESGAAYIQLNDIWILVGQRPQVVVSL